MKKTADGFVGWGNCVYIRLAKTVSCQPCMTRNKVMTARPLSLNDAISPFLRQSHVLISPLVDAPFAAPWVKKDLKYGCCGEVLLNSAYSNSRKNGREYTCHVSPKESGKSGKFTNRNFLKGTESCHHLPRCAPSCGRFFPGGDGHMQNVLRHAQAHSHSLTHNHARTHTYTLPTPIPIWLWKKKRSLDFFYKNAILLKIGWKIFWWKKWRWI